MDTCEVVDCENIAQYEFTMPLDGVLYRKICGPCIKKIERVMSK